MSSEVLLTFFITSLVLILTPGPDILYVLSQSITRGSKYGIATTLGQIGGLLFHLSLFAFGVSGLIIGSELIFTAVKIMGACYLFWLSYKVYNTADILVREDQQAAEKSFMGFVRQGLLMNIMNPKVMMFFLALFPTFISENAGNIKVQVFTLGLVFITQTLVVFTTVSIIASQLTDVLKSNRTFNSFLKWMQIVVFTGLGIYILI
ncbi:LysE family translocator [Flavobacterium sp. JP2137]|uniref:LysE family translocator n=1 Tax=Flavobacterium sp. JP2137 TaxID=3414510 RepID=UPI003D30171F